MRRILYNTDGTVSIIHPAPKSRRAGETETHWLKRVLGKATPENVEYEDMDESKLPQSREFRNAWTGKKGKGVNIDEIKAQKIREMRE